MQAIVEGAELSEGSQIDEITRSGHSSRPLKVLRVIRSTDPRDGGPIEGYLQSAGILQELGHHCAVVTLDSPDDPWVVDFPFPVFATGHVKWPPMLRRYRYSPNLVPWLRENAENYDAIIISGIWNYCALACRRALPGGRVPYFVFAHGMLDPWFRATFPLKHLIKQISWWICEGPLLKGARRVIFTSEEERRSARNAFWPYKINEIVVGYGTTDPTGDAGAQIRTFKENLPALGDRPFLLFLSRIHRKKGCDILIEAFASLVARGSKLDLVVAGPDQDGLKAELIARATHLGVGDRIHWPGMLKGEQKWGAFRACEAFILPSHSENFGIVVAEALACGKPVLTTNKVNIWREIEEDGAGLIADDTEPSVTRMLKDFSTLSAERRREMGKAARLSFLSRFDLRRNQFHLLELIANEITQPSN